MIEFDVDMGYLLEEGELDCVILNDENGEHEPMKFTPELVSGTCELGNGTCEMEYGGDIAPNTAKVMDVYFCSECGSPTYNDCMPYYCIYCGKAVKR